MAEAFLAEEDAPHRQTQLLGLVQELLSKIAVGKVPEVLAALKGEGKGAQHGLLHAVGVQREDGDSRDVDLVGAGHDGVQYVVLRTQHTAGLNINGD